MRTPFHIKYAPDRTDAASKPSPPSPEQAKFQDLLRELFQFDCADLDFGIYRIMNHKRKVLDEYIERDLPGAIENAVEQGALGTAAERARIFAEKADKTRELLGEDAIGPTGELIKYSETPVGQQYVLWRSRALHSEPADMVRRDIYNHLYAFFSRYYQDGDFVPRHRYSHDHPYVVPYNGEDVHFHWANRDQYYVKAAEQFRDYRYLSPSGVSVRFFLRSANVEQNDVRGHKRFFFPLLNEAVWDKKRRALQIPFECRPLTSAEAKTFGRNGQQDAIFKQAEVAASKGLPTVPPEAAKSLLDHRRMQDAGDGENARTLFAHHAARFSRCRTSDFFVHRDLGEFLGRELHFYLTSQVANLDSMTAAGEEVADAWLDKVRTIREVGTNIIEFLAQIEGFQKMLWEKRKFVVDVQYCVAASLIPETLMSHVLDCEAQWTEWRELGCTGIDGTLLDGDDAEARRVFLRDNPGALLDTRHFDPGFVDDLLGAMEDIDEKTDGLAIKSENWQALNLLRERYGGSLSCIYIDPPYNTGDSEILYKNGYLMSSWLSLMADRLLLARRLLKNDSAFFIAIDDFELRDLCALVDTVLPEFRRDLIVVNHHPQGGKAKTLSTTHEYMVACTKGAQVLRGRDRSMSVEKRPFKRSGTAESNFRRGRPNSFYAVLVHPESLRVMGIEEPPVGDKYPIGPTPEGYERVYPLGGDGSERVWRKAYESCLSLLDGASFAVSKNMVIYQLLGSKDRSKAVFSNWIDKRHNASTWGANLLTSVMGDRHAFSYPKSIHTVADAIDSVTIDGQAVVLDYFAGSGTTGHAVINLNREDGGRRKFVLAEMGDHFDTVLMPRLKKVAFSPAWKNGKAERRAETEEVERGPRIIKYFTMEGYEDALGNLEFQKPDGDLFGLEDYLLRYMLQWETKGSATLMNVEALDRPFDYKLHLNGNGQGADVAVDLPETFSYLLGLSVTTRRVYDDDGRRYLVYTAQMQDGRTAVVIWRDTAGWTLQDRERDRAFVERSGFAADADEIWMNGDSMVKDARSLDALFKQRMFASAAE